MFCHAANAWYHQLENRIFVQYARKARAFADVGSAEGFYSSIFASIHGSSAEILSIDCGSPEGCNPSHSLIVIDQNSKAFRPRRWDYVQAYVTNSELKSPGFPLPAETAISTLPALLRSNSFTPDLIKFDIESSEYEVILDSLAYLSDSRPVLIIEVHNEILRARGLSFRPPFEALKSIGYELVACDNHHYLKADNCHIVMRYSR